MKTKICSTCNKDLPLTSFSKKTAVKLQSKCKSCQSKYAAQHYQKNKQAYKARTKKSNAALSKRNADYINDYKQQRGCCKCSEREPVALDFHHVDSEEKEFNVSRLSKSSYSLNKIKSEIDKCVVICANCHRKLHAGLIEL